MEFGFFSLLITAPINVINEHYFDLSLSFFERFHLKCKHNKEEKNTMRNGLANGASIMDALETNNKKTFDFNKNKSRTKNPIKILTFRSLFHLFRIILIHLKIACRTGTVHMYAVGSVCVVQHTSGLNCNAAWSICNSILLLPYVNDDDTYHATTPQL